MELTNKKWEEFKKQLYYNSTLGLTLDYSAMNLAETFFQEMKPRLEQAFDRMESLEKGAVVNPSEERMVGHYWLRAPHLAPTQEIAQEITNTIAMLKAFAERIHSGQYLSSKEKVFRRVLLIGIGGSALGPQFLTEALGTKRDLMEIFFLDNTDPDGFDRIFEKLGDYLEETLVIVISKSGGTIETRNGMLETREIFKKEGLDFAKQAVAVSLVGSMLDRLAQEEGWLARFPMWDWVGGRTSETSAVGLLPAALQGFDIDELLRGAAQCDLITRKREIAANPAALLALMWYAATGGEGGQTLAVLPYKDRLQLFSKYLQQLVMESLGKERDLANKVVNQGLALFGNKGSTDQHSYLQQLLEGPHNTFVTIIEVLKDRQGQSPLLDPDVTSGDYLHALLQGTRIALRQKGRPLMTLTIEETNAFYVGVLIALFERAVGLYAWLININAYDQPAVEAGKKGMKAIIELQREILGFLRNNQEEKYTAYEIAVALDKSEQTDAVFKILEHLRANPHHGVGKLPEPDFAKSRYFQL